ncbi:MAG: hypothetical protein LBJ21_04035 [Acidobacteriota bacterium]|nr:hypothetical protein [Acidobacteriota bacterium]
MSARLLFDVGIPLEAIDRDELKIEESLPSKKILRLLATGKTVLRLRKVK